MRYAEAASKLLALENSEAQLKSQLESNQTLINDRSGQLEAAKNAVLDAQALTNSFENIEKQLRHTQEELAVTQQLKTAFEGGKEAAESKAEALLAEVNFVCGGVINKFIARELMLFSAFMLITWSCGLNECVTLRIKVFVIHNRMRFYKLALFSTRLRCVLYVPAFSIICISRKIT